MKLRTLLSTVALCSLVAAPIYATPAKPAQPTEAKIKKAAEEAQKMIADSIPKLNLDKVTGDPVVAKIGKRQIKLSEVAANFQNIPAELRQLPIDLIFLITLDQMVKKEVLKTKALEKKDTYLKDPQVKEMIEKATEDIITAAYAKEQVDSQITEAVLKKEYADKVLSKYPKDAEQADVYEIFVPNEKVTEIENKIKQGIDFIKLARENNPKEYPMKDGHRGLVNEMQAASLPKGYDAIFKKEKNAYTVPNGKHIVIKLPDEKHSLIVKVISRQKLEAPKFSELKDRLQAMKQKELLDAHNKELMKNTKVEILNPSDGKPLPPFDDMMKILEDKLKGKIDQIQKMAQEEEPKK